MTACRDSSRRARRGIRLHARGACTLSTPWMRSRPCATGGQGSPSGRCAAGRQRRTRPPRTSSSETCAALQHPYTPRGSWSDGHPPRSDAAYVDVRMTRMTFAREGRSAAPRQRGDPSTEYGLLHIVCKVAACGVDHCSRRRGRGRTCGDARSGLVSARALRAASGRRELRPAVGAIAGRRVLTARENRTGGAGQGSAT